MISNQTILVLIQIIKYRYQIKIWKISLSLKLSFTNAMKFLTFLSFIGII